MVSISVIMPVYNASEFLNMSINSLIKQSFNDLELICVDDGSTDNSLEILNKFSSKYNFIKVIRQKNMGSGKARNNGIDNASGDYIAFLDADDIFVDKNALEIMYKTAVNNNADMVCGNLKRLTKDKKIIEDIHKNEAYSFFDDYGFISPKEYGVPWAFYKNIFKRNFLNQYNIRFPDLKRGQDPVFLANVLVHMINIPVTPVTLYGYNFSVGGGTDNKINSYDKKKDYITHFKETFNILNNHGFEVVSEKYKKYLFNFLNNPNNYNDLDLYDIVIDVFGNDESFKNYNDEFVFFKITHLLNLLKVSDSNDFFKKVKSEFLIMDIESNCIIENNLKEEFNIVCESNNINTCKLNLLQFEINNLKSENQKLNNNYKKLKNDNYYLRKLNNELLNSSSWKITKPLRTFKRIFRK
ncbi:glycosyltransferase family 2 protein [uncultured Methanobrevibacter sp.]|uniref:glycosyltransferase family 2 protein n=1 Tax=uncultured Methanobrevibacter sp. TaxID=253161 RepID=UPI00258BD65B|nr:glycosyltransferase family 2 protein [uncultured Methanobrevibacter sp.]